MLMQGVLSNGMVSKLLLKYMQGKGGLRTKMVLPRNKMQVYIYLQKLMCLSDATMHPGHSKFQDHNMLFWAFSTYWP